MTLGVVTGESGFAHSSPPLEASGELLVVPDAQLLFSADYSRLGDDLLLTGGDGAGQVIAGYFASDSPPALASPEGAVLTPQVIAQLAGPRAPGQYAQAEPAEGPAPIGQVETVTGSATVVRGGLPVSLETGDPVFQNDVVRTGLASDLVIGFADGTIFSLSANARMVLDGMVYDPAGPSNSLTLSVVQGVFSFVTGQIAPTGGMEITTPVATLGIRGTTVHGILESIAGPLTVFLGRNQLGSAARVILVDPLTRVPIANLDNLGVAFFLDSVGARPLLRPLTAPEQEFGLQRADLIHGVQSTFGFRYDTGDPIVQPGEALRTEAGPRLPSGGIGFDRDSGAGEALEGGLLQGLEASSTLTLLDGSPLSRLALENGPDNFRLSAESITARIELGEPNASTGEGTTSSGQIILTGGTTPVESLTLAGLTFMAGGAPLALTSGGVPVSVVQSGTETQGFAGGVQVFSFRLNSDGSFTFSLFRPLDHPAAGATGAADTIEIGFEVVVTFVDGTTLQTSILSVVLDSGPMAASVAEAVNENSGLGVPVTGNLPILAGRDGLKSVELTGQSGALTSGGRAVGLVQVAEDTFLGLTADGTEIFRMVFDVATGDYAFSLLQPIDHGAVGVDSLDLVFQVAVTDGDNDSVISTITITALDDIPAVGANAPVSVQETALPDGSGGGAAVASGTLAFVAGADGARIATLTLGDQVGVLQGDYLVLSGAFFELRVHTLSGDYVYTLTDSTQAHAAGEPLVQSFAYMVRDGDGDTAVGHLEVRVDDDAPIARDDFDMVLLGGSTGGNVITGADANDPGGSPNLGEADVPGADGPGLIRSIEHGNVLYTLNAAGNGIVTTDATTGLPTVAPFELLAGKLTIPTDEGGAFSIQLIASGDPGALGLAGEYDYTAPDGLPGVPGGIETLTFEGLDAGTYDGTDGAVDGTFQVFADGGFVPILVSASNPFLLDTNAAVIFDSANPGLLPGLGTPNEDFQGPGTGAGGEAGAPFENKTPLGKTLIVSNAGAFVDTNNDGLIDDPFVQGLTKTTLVFDFSSFGAVRLDSIDVQDIAGFVIPGDPGSGQQAMTLNFYDAAVGGTLLGSVSAPQTGENGVAAVDLGGVSGVVRMEVVIDGSGAVDNIVFAPIVVEDATEVFGYTIEDGDGDTSAASLEVLVKASARVLAPGNSAGTLAIDSNLTIDGQVLEIELGGTGAGESDLIDVAGHAALLDGLIEVSLIDGYLPDHGDEIVFLSADGGLTARPEPLSISLSGVASGFDFDVNFGPGAASFIALNDAEAGDSMLFLGGARDDTFVGGAGDDAISGGAGDDILFGDGGADTFSFSLSGHEGDDTIGDLSVDEGDRLAFEDVVDGLGNPSSDYDDVFVAGSFAKVDSTVKVTLQSGTVLAIEDLNGAIDTLDDLMNNSVIV